MLVGLVIYSVNMVIGKGRNTQLAQDWFAANRRILEEQFALVGDDGKQKEITSSDGTESANANASADSNAGADADGSLNGHLADTDADAWPHAIMKETESLFRVWCSGRVAVDSLLIELRFIKRHDLVSLISHFLKPQHDQIVRFSFPFHTFHGHIFHTLHGHIFHTFHNHIIHTLHGHIFHTLCAHTAFLILFTPFAFVSFVIYCFL